MEEIRLHDLSLLFSCCLFSLCQMLMVDARVVHNVYLLVQLSDVLPLCYRTSKAIYQIPNKNLFLVDNFQIIRDNGYLPGFPHIGGRGTAPDYLGKIYYGQFPEDFRWGIVSTPTRFESDDGSNNDFDIATDYKDIVRRLKALGVGVCFNVKSLLC